MEAENILVYPIERPTVHLAKDLTDGKITMLLQPQNMFKIRLIGDGEDTYLIMDREKLEDLARSILVMLHQS